MKKIIALSLALLCLALAACSSAPAIVLHETLPWSVGVETLKEQSTYRVTRYLGNCDDVDLLDDNVADKPLVITHEASYVTYTLYEGWGVRVESDTVIPFKDDTTKGFTLLTMTLEVWYLNEEYVPARYVFNTYGDGVAEKIVSYAVFDRYNLSARFSYRETNLVEIKGEDLNHKMWVDYTGDVLGKKIARIKYRDNPAFVESSIKSGEYYDNEYLFYYLRALKTTDGGANTTLNFNFSLPYENLLNKKKVKSRSLVSTTSKDDVALSPNILSKQEFDSLIFDPGDGILNLDSMPSEQKADENDSLKLCSYTTLMLSDKKSGPPIKLYYSRYPVRENRAEGLFYPLNKLLMQVKTYTYGYATTESGSSYFDSNNPQFSQVYQLLKYSQSDRDISDPKAV